jgi:hypothetical protein
MMSNGVGQSQVSTFALLAGAAAAVAASAAAAGATAAIRRCMSHHLFSFLLLGCRVVCIEPLQPTNSACLTVYVSADYICILCICRLPKPRLASQAWQALLDDEGRIHDQQRFAGLCQQV